MSNHKHPRYDKPSTFVTFRLARLQNDLNAQATALLKSRTNLSLVEWRLILCLQMFENASPTELAGHILMDKGQLSRKITAMAKKGLLLISKDSRDQRVQHLKLTETALRLSELMMPIMEARQDLLLADVSPEQLDVFYDVLEKIQAAAKIREVKP